MADREVQRRLAAILAADVAGYTRLMEADTDGTVAAWQDAREDVIKPLVTDHSGKIVKLTGDGFLVEFPTVQDAVNCAIAMQDSLQASSLDFRMGVNLGDIVDDGEDIHGEGVNVAARIESLADAGGISISGMVYESIRNRIDVDYEDRGEHQVKNVSATVRVYAIGVATPEEPVADVSVPVAEFEDRPAIAVLPFDNLSNDPEQEYFSDGITEDIITALSKLAGLLVIARNSTFVYKDRAVDIRQVAEELNVKYVLEGSVRRSGGRIRVTAQLIEAKDGTHIWAERYDRDLDDIFAVQDEITLVIATEMQANLTEGDQARLRYTTTSSVEAWTLWVQGLAHFRGAVTKDGMGQARPFFEKALALDPKSAPLNALLGFLHYANARFGWWTDREAALKTAHDYVDSALELDPDNVDALMTLGVLSLARRQFDEAVTQIRKAVKLGPSSADAHTMACFVLASSGFPEEAIGNIERAMTLSPHYPAHYIGHHGNALRLSHRTEEAIVAFKKYGERNPGFGLSDLVIAYHELNRLDKMNAAAEDLLAARPDFTIDSWLETQFRKDTDRLAADVAALVSAGLPERQIVTPDPAPSPETEKPSIAVLPFDNLSGDPEQEYFSDGISEDIITALSHVRQFFVIARNTTFTYKGQAVDVQAVAKELGVNYVLEGSVRRAGNRVRITAQLIDGNSGNHLWAEKYDRDIADIFEVQDDITQTVVGAIEPELYRAEQDRARRKPSENLDAWDLCQQGVWHSWHDTMDHSLAARRLLREAIELDPEICLAHAFLAFALWRAVVFHLTENPREAMDEALMAGKRAIDLDQGNAHAHWAMGAVYMHQCEHELARAELASAIRINPSFANAYQYLGWTMAYDGEPEEGIRQVQMAQRLSPNDPMAWGMILIQAQAHLNMKDFAKAEQMARQAKLLTDNLPIKCALLAAMGHTGNLDDAPALIEQVLAIVPEFTVSKITDIFPFKHQADIDTWVEGLRRAGVPEE